MEFRDRLSVSGELVTLLLELAQSHCTSTFFFLNDAAPPDISPLPLHDPLPFLDPRPRLRGASARPLPPPPRPLDGLLHPPAHRRVGLAARDGHGRGRRRSRDHRRDHAHRSEERTSELQSPCNLVCRLLLEKKQS